MAAGKRRVRVYPWIGSGRDNGDPTRWYTRTRRLPVRLPLLLGKGIIRLWLWLDVGLWESPGPV